jgi:glyoxylase-like metal-dependent hydrolase (beta-lactamase superfamily II)
MGLNPGRRRFLQAVAASVAAAPLKGLRAQGQAAPLAAVSLADDLLQITGAGANVLVLRGPDGLLLVDGGLPDRSAGLLAFVAAQTQSAPVRVLFNTQWHSDHTGSNETLGLAGARIIAHENTRRWLSSRVTRESQSRVYPPRPAHAVPAETIAAPGTLQWGGERIEYGPLPPAHTNGDIYLFFPAANVLVASDILTVGRYPNMDYSTGGWINGVIESCERLEGVGDAATRVVPGLGPAQPKAALKAEREMLVTVRDRVVEMIRQGRSLREVVAAAPTKEFDAAWGDPAAFLEATYVGLVRHTRELGGIL